MSTTFASIAALLLYALLLAPLLFLLRGGGVRAALLVYAAALAGLIAASADFFGPSPSAAVSVPARNAAGGSPEACAEVLRVTEQAGIVVDRSNPRRVVVRGRPWNQLPRDARDVLLACMGGGAPGEEETLPEVVEVD